MVKECIVLAGGLGTRLRSVVNDAPKCLAPVNGRPFLYYVFRFLKKQGVSRVILSLGYKHEQIADWCGTHEKELHLVYATEPEPLGTGGAIRLALQQVTGDEALILNGDTLFDLNLEAFHAFHHGHDALLTLALKPMQQFDRYGSVNIDNKLRVLSFEEKGFYEKGLINGGVYLLKKKPFLQLPLPEKFSFENDFLVPYANSLPFYGYVEDTYFIDIGIPEDYQRANKEFVN
jgi:D-glycero-alpha-D-manno-heptose 1-phosphate guanylyltransferase